MNARHSLLKFLQLRNLLGGGDLVASSALPQSSHQDIFDYDDTSLNTLSMKEGDSATAPLEYTNDSLTGRASSGAVGPCPSDYTKSVDGHREEDAIVLDAANAISEARMAASGTAMPVQTARAIISAVPNSKSAEVPLGSLSRAPRRWWKSRATPNWAVLLDGPQVVAWIMSYLQHGPKTEYVYEVTHEDATRTLIKITDADASGREASITRLSISAPVRPSVEELQYLHTVFSSGIVRFSEDHCGLQVGNGECWTFGDQALRHAHARPALGYNFGVGSFSFSRRANPCKNSAVSAS